MLKDPTKVENSGISAPNVKWPAKTKAAKMMKNTKKYAPNVPSATCMVCHTLENDALSCTKRNVDKKAKIKHKAFMLVMWLYLLNVPRDGKREKETKKPRVRSVCKGTGSIVPLRRYLQRHDVAVLHVMRQGGVDQHDVGTFIHDDHDKHGQLAKHLQKE